MLKLAIVFAVVAVCCVHAKNRYYIYTRNNPSVPQEIIPDHHFPDLYGNENQTYHSNFSQQNNTIVLIHGHRGNAKTLFNTLITDSILRFQEPHNVIVVDWEQEANHSYSVASARVPFVARDLEYFLRELTYHTSTTSANRVHLVGFGLGAHVAGIASRHMSYVAWFDLPVVGRITGLDPSGRGWGSNSARLRNTDADYVEVIHTDGSGLLANGIGTAIGHVNFYVNGGSNQPGCSTHSCSHNRAFELFADSMYDSNLVGFPCSSTTEMILNSCKGSALNVGGTEMFKRASSSIYRINTRSSSFQD